ncbi:MAG: redoxin domain-containing protein [Gammaproteobacteria bacterium]|nr:redoxin domain-containing protein [Gammaproteobacteria bacterium]
MSGKMMPVRQRLILLLILCASQSACSLLFPTEAGESLSHFDATAPAEAAPAPDFRLTDIDGNTVALHDLVGEKPVVVQLGSYSCPVFRYRRFDMQELQREFVGRVDFVVIYTQEAHPVDSINPYVDRVWNPWINKIAGVNVPAHASEEQRRGQASATFDLVDLDSRFLVDGMDNAVWQQYGAAPSAAYVLDLRGNIYMRQPWVYPREIREALNEILAE